MAQFSAPYIHHAPEKWSKPVTTKEVCMSRLAQDMKKLAHRAVAAIKQSTTANRWRNVLRIICWRRISR
jgi:hypothetical protein